jgi:hypothetical protein
MRNIGEYSFEEFVAELWQRRGWNTKVTDNFHHKGVDVVAKREHPYPEKEIIQAKQYASGNNVSRPEIQQYASLLQEYKNADKVIIVCTSGFTEPALSLSEKLNIKCININKLANMVMENESTDLIKEFSTDTEVNNSGSQEEQSIVSKPEEQNDLDGVVSKGDGLIVEIVGAGHLEYRMKEKSHDLSSEPNDNSESEKNESPLFFAIKIINTGHDLFYMREFESMKLIDSNGREHTPISIDLSDNLYHWVSFGNEKYGLSPGNTCKTLLRFDVPVDSDITVISHEYGIQFDFEDRNYDELPGLPDDLKPELKSLMGNSEVQWYSRD